MSVRSLFRFNDGRRFNFQKKKNPHPQRFNRSVTERVDFFHLRCQTSVLF